MRDLLRHIEQTGAHLVLIDHADRLPPAIAAHSARLELSLPDEAELEKLVVEGLRRANRQSPIRILTRRDGILAVARGLRGLTRSQAERVVFDTVSDDRTFDDADVEGALAQKRRLLGGDGVLESIEIPASMEDLGGMDNLKDWLRRRSPEALGAHAAAYGLEASRGVLILGVQGAGKSLCAKAIAAAWRRSLLRLDPGALYNSYIGASEQRLRDALRQAEAMAPIVLWIDEIEKGFASAASRSTDGGLSQRMFGSLLTWMQEHRSPVFLTATANDIEALPPELLRKGRFDEIFFVDLPSRRVREDICAIHLKKRNQDPKSFDLGALAEASRGRSGAEIEQAIISASYDALDAGKPLNADMIVRCLERSPPLSVTMRERIAALRAWAKSRCVPADSRGPDD
jgi:SpoVK/Ycf46/Vps4 family AAA+-type ATPase